MHLVNQVYLVTPLGWSVLNIVENFTGVINPRSRGGINFNQINKTPFIHTLATAALTAGFGLLALLAVDRFCQDPGERGLAHATRTAEKEGMMHPVLLKRVTQGIDNMILAHHIGKTSGPPLAGECLITHERSAGVMIRLSLLRVAKS